MGTSLSNSDSESESVGPSANQFMWPTQEPYFNELWKSGQSMMQDQPYVQQGQQAGAQFASQMKGQLYDPLTGAYQQAFGQGNPYAQASSQLTQPLISGLTNIMNQPTEAFGAGGSNPLLDKNVALALEQASTDLSRNMLPQIGRSAEAAGQYGGSRQQIAEGLALSDANRNALQSAMGAYGDQYQSDRAANLLSQQQADATRLAAGQQISNLMGAQQTGVGQGVQTGMNLANLGMGQMDAYGNAANLGWSPLMNQAALLGQPVTLGEYGGGASSSDASATKFTM